MVRRVAILPILIAIPAVLLAAPSVRVERQVENVGPWAFKRIQMFHEDLREERFDYVRETLDEMRDHPKLNSHERAIMWQGYGYLYISTEDYERAADALGKCIETQGLPFSSELHARYNRAQILVMRERSEDAIAEFEVWFQYARKPSPSAYYMAAMAYMQSGKNQKALEYADLAIAGASQPKESWLQLKNAMLVEEKDYDGAEKVLEQLIELYPKKTYWMQLAAVYSETRRHERALSTLEMAYLQGYLDKESERLTLAQMYLFNQIPYEAAEVLRDSLEDGVVDGDAKDWELLADSWLHARERDKALPAMRKAAELSGDGNTYLRLAQLLIDREEWSEARHALEQALAKGNLRHPGHTQLLLGIADANENRWGDAQQAFAKAQQDEKTRKAADYWLRQVDKEMHG